MSDLVALTLLAAEERARAGARAELRARGVVATPSALARRAVARVDALLRSELGLAAGLASERLVIVDPAVGTGVWLAAVLERTRASGAGGQLLGFDTDPDALEVATRLLGPEARAQGAALTLSCANTLELGAPFPDQARVRVILGNPPWAARSLARGGVLSDAWLSEFRRDHTGAPLGERRLGVLSDDYVRFFRWALEHARASPHGALVCFATNASFLDGPVHRGMRAALLKGFDVLELLDLGGNSLLSRAADHQRDDNVFGVRVGAALTWAVRKPSHLRTSELARPVRFAALRGSLAEKLAALAGESTAGVEHTPSGPWFRFRPPDEGASVRSGFSIAEAFPFQREGVQTNRDALAIAGSHDELTERVRDLISGRIALSTSRHFDPLRARARLREATERGESCIAQLAYRPLDDRFFVTLAPLCHRPRSELRAAVARSTLCLLAVRKDRGAAAFNLFAAARHVADACFLSTRSSCRTRVFPSHAPDGSPNLCPRIAERVAQRIARLPRADELIAYALSVLGSPRHRSEHQSALQLDYAHLPWPRDASHFERAVAVGLRFAHALDRERPADEPSIEPAAPVAPLEPLGMVQYDEASRAVRASGRIVLRGVEPAWWQAQVGHHGLVASLLSRSGERASLSQLVDVLARAACWQRAEQAADALLCESSVTR